MRFFISFTRRMKPALSNRSLNRKKLLPAKNTNRVFQSACPLALTHDGEIVSIKKLRMLRESDGEIGACTHLGCYLMQRLLQYGIRLFLRQFVEHRKQRFSG